MSLSCNICSAGLEKPIYQSVADFSTSSLGEIVEGRNEVFFCDDCAHLQTREIQNVEEYYDTQYKILVNSEDEDQIYKFEEGRKIFRYDFQAETLLQKIKLDPAARILEYGAAKGATLKRILSQRPDLEGHVFDVSEMYTEFWDAFLGRERQATYTCPEDWQGRFDCVFSCYVLEHVVDLAQLMKEIDRLLVENGLFYFIVPNTYENIADFVVADHSNHFSEPCLQRLLARFGFDLLDIDSQTHDAAFLVTCRKSNASSQLDVRAAVAQQKVAAEDIAAYWLSIGETISAFERGHPEARAAVYGAGFYGSYLYSSLEDSDRISCFVDQNPHLQGRELFGRPIIAPQELPAEIDTLYVGLNPRHARQTVAGIQSLVEKNLECLYL